MSLANYFQFDLPSSSRDKLPVDNWQTSAWTASYARPGSSAGSRYCGGALPLMPRGNHFFNGNNSIRRKNTSGTFRLKDDLSFRVARVGVQALTVTPLRMTVIVCRHKRIPSRFHSPGALFDIVFAAKALGRLSSRRDRGPTS